MKDLRGSAGGFALVLVLWVVALLTVLAGSFAFAMRTESQLTANLVARTQAETLAEGGVHIGIARLLEPEIVNRWQVDGTAYAIEIGGHPVTVAIFSEFGKVDLNRAADSLLRAVIAYAIEEAGSEHNAQALADAVGDWRDGNRSRRLQGAEDPDYLAAGKSHGARDGPFLSVGELTQVMGMTPQIYQKLAPLVTVHSGRSRIDPGTASRSVLLALPAVTEEQVDAYLLSRETAAKRGAPPPVQLLTSGADMLSAPTISSRVTSGTFTVMAQAAVGNARVARAAVIRARATRSVSRRRNAVRQLRLPYTVIGWTDEPRNEFAARMDAESGQ